MQNIAETVFASSWFIPSILIGSLAIGCASISDTRNPTTVDTVRNVQDVSRAERVFLYQSHVANAMLDHYPLLEVLENADPTVVDAEARMTESCSPLTQAVLAHIAGEETSLGLRLRVMATVDDCERAALKLDELLQVTAVADSI